MIDLITVDPYNSKAQDWRRQFNVQNGSHWALLPADAAVSIPIPIGIDLLEISGANNVILSPDPIIAAAAVGVPLTGRYYLDGTIIIVDGFTTLYAYSRIEMDLVVNFYRSGNQ